MCKRYLKNTKFSYFLIINQIPTPIVTILQRTQMTENKYIKLNTSYAQLLCSMSFIIMLAKIILKKCNNEKAIIMVFPYIFVHTIIIVMTFEEIEIISLIPIHNAKFSSHFAY